MRELIVYASFGLVIATYVFYSVKDGSWFNVLTPQLFFAIPSMYIAQLARLGLGLDEPAAVSSWFYVFACHSIPLLVYVLALVYGSVPRVLIVSKRSNPTIGNAAWVLLALGVLLYVPIAIEFRSDLLNPRAIYNQTRSGYGLNFFVSTMLVNLAFVLYLFKTSSAKHRCGFFVIGAALALAHGSKGSVLVLAMLWLIHWRYVDGRLTSMTRAAILMTAMSSGLIGLFYIFSTGIEANEIASYIVGYSDYTSNALMIVDGEKPALLGKIFLEDNLYSRIPRAIFPDKPRDFGTFYLAKLYFPESFDLDQGTPGFGIGALFADFKWATLPILCVMSYPIAILTKAYQRMLARFRRPGDFIVFTFLCGVPMISIGVGYFLPEHLLLAVAITLLLAQNASVNIRRRGSRPAF